MKAQKFWIFFHNRVWYFKRNQRLQKNILPCKKLIQHGFRGNLVQTSSFVAAQNKTYKKNNFKICSQKKPNHQT